jgi:hypothetical protein
MVLGLELLHRSSHTDEQANHYRTFLVKAAERLRRRRCDVLAAKGARLIDVFLSVEESLVIAMMRKRGGSIEDNQREAIYEIIQNQELLAKFLDFDNTGLQALDMVGPSPISMESFEANFPDIDSIEDFDEWFSTVFEPEYTMGMT